MPSEDEDERPGSDPEESENDNDNEDETMRDDLDEDAAEEDDADADGASNSSEGSDDPKNQEEQSQTNAEANGVTSSPRDGSSHVEDVAPSAPRVRPEALTASTYDIVPTVAAPQSTSINALTATADMRWVFSGGSDGYIRKYNWVESVNSKLMLTVAQKHPFVDSVQKAGALMTYWENFATSRTGAGSHDDSTLSPVYALAAQKQGLWLLSGLDSGTIRLQSVRHDEGKEIAMLQKHTSAVSVLQLSSDEDSLLSGSWDKTVNDWDLDVGKVRSTFGSSAGQISAIEFRPQSSLPVPPESGEQHLTNGTFSSNTAARDGPTAVVNGLANREQSRTVTESNTQAGSPNDSLFGGDDGDDDLFGDAAGTVTNGASLGDAFGDDDDEFSRAIADGPQPEGDVPPADVEMGGTETTAPPVQPPEPSTATSQPDKPDDEPQKTEEGLGDQEMTNGLPHAEDIEAEAKSNGANGTDEAPKSGTTFLSASIDGPIRVWDRRQPNPVAKIIPHKTPPWCMNACWSPDGNFIYAGRRNGTVEEYSLHKGLRAPERVFKFPQGSGAVTSVRPMPNGRHLLCASYDILRLYDLKESQSSRSTVPFLIVPGHRTGVVSQLYMDPACRFMISTGGNRGWEGQSTEVLLGYEIGCLQ